MNGDQLLADTDVEDALSEAYVWAVATHAKYVLAKKNFDRDGVDLTIEGGAELRPKLDCQLKATVNLEQYDDENWKFVCPVKNYNKLIISTQTPRILIVMKLPKEKDDWLRLSDTELIIKNAAYWVSLKGQAETENKNAITISIPKSQRLSVESLRDLMEKSRTGAL